MNEADMLFSVTVPGSTANLGLALIQSEWRSADI